MKRFLLILSVGLLLTACAQDNQASAAPAPPQEPPSSAAQRQPEPAPGPKVDNAWRFDLPEQHGMNAQVLAQLHQALAQSTVYAMVTAKDGVIVDEYYREGYDEDSAFALHSCSKSFTGALVGIAIEQGYIGGVDDLLSDYLPQVAGLTDGKQALTLRHLLTHTSGLEWYEWGGGASNWDEFRSAPNWVEYILNQQQVAEPGARFNYSTGNSHLLAAALEQATGRNALDYGREMLFDPLGMESVTWGSDPQGVADGGNGIVMTARDAARFGQLFLQGGAWQEQQLVPAGWVTESTAAQNNGAGDGTGSYGFHWWTRPFGANQYDAYYAFGAWGQYIFVVPELELVTVIASQGPQNSYLPRPYFTDYILAACEEQGA